MSVAECNNCGSERVAYFRLDSDIASTAGYWMPANPQSEAYTESDVRSFSDNTRTCDIELHVCCSCGTVWEAPDPPLFGDWRDG